MERERSKEYTRGTGGGEGRSQANDGGGRRGRESPQGCMYHEKLLPYYSLARALARAPSS
jgi:hypothetical protein